MHVKSTIKHKCLNSYAVHQRHVDYTWGREKSFGRLRQGNLENLTKATIVWDQSFEEHLPNPSFFPALNNNRLNLFTSRRSQRGHLSQQWHHLGPVHILWLKKVVSIWRDLFSFPQNVCKGPNKSFGFCFQSTAVQFCPNLWLQLNTTKFRWREPTSSHRPGLLFF